MKDFYDVLVESLPVGIDRTVLRILQSCVGQSKAITRANLLNTVHKSAVLKDASDRQLRKVIQDLRGQGVRICNLVDGDGYYIAQNDDEYQAWRGKYMAYATTIWQTICSMDERRRVPITDEATLQREVERKTAAVQPGLFG